MTLFRDGLALPLDHTGPLVAVIRGCFGLELTWLKKENHNGVEPLT